jgi:hypothetical protein
MSNVLTLRPDIDIPIKRATYIHTGHSVTDKVFTKDDFMWTQDDDSSTGTLTLSYDEGMIVRTGTCVVYSDYVGTWTEFTIEGLVTMHLHVGVDGALAFLNTLQVVCID